VLGVEGDDYGEGKMVIELFIVSVVGVRCVVVWGYSGLKNKG